VTFSGFFRAVTLYSVAGPSTFGRSGVRADTFESYPDSVVYMGRRRTVAHEMFGLSFTLPTITQVQLVQILVAISVPYVMFRITQMSQVITWVDLAVAIGLVTTPITVILAFQGILGGASSVGILSAIMLSSLGVIVTD